MAADHGGSTSRTTASMLAEIECGTAAEAIMAVRYTGETEITLGFRSCTRTFPRSEGASLFLRLHKSLVILRVG